MNNKSNEDALVLSEHELDQVTGGSTEATIPVSNSKAAATAVIGKTNDADRHQQEWTIVYETIQRVV